MGGYSNADRTNKETKNTPTQAMGNTTVILSIPKREDCSKYAQRPRIYLAAARKRLMYRNKPQKQEEAEKEINVQKQATETGRGRERD